MEFISNEQLQELKKDSGREYHHYPITIQLEQAFQLKRIADALFDIIKIIKEKKCNIQ